MTTFPIHNQDLTHTTCNNWRDYFSKQNFTHKKNYMGLFNPIQSLVWISFPLSFTLLEITLSYLLTTFHLYPTSTHNLANNMNPPHSLKLNILLSFFALLQGESLYFLDRPTPSFTSSSSFSTKPSSRSMYLSQLCP